MAATADVPEGFEPFFTTDKTGFTAINGPLYIKQEDGVLVLGLWVEERHCNLAGMAHGGMMAYLADMLLILTCRQAEKVQGFTPTITLTCDFVGAAKKGAWLEGRGKLVKGTRSIMFSEGLFTVDGQPVMRCNSILKRPNPTA